MNTAATLRMSLCFCMRMYIWYEISALRMIDSLLHNAQLRLTNVNCAARSRINIVESEWFWFPQTEIDREIWVAFDDERSSINHCPQRTCRKANVPPIWLSHKFIRWMRSRVWPVAAARSLIFHLLLLPYENWPIPWNNHRLETKEIIRNGILSAYSAHMHGHCVHAVWIWWTSAIEISDSALYARLSMIKSDSIAISSWTVFFFFFQTSICSSPIMNDMHVALHSHARCKSNQTTLRRFAVYRRKCVNQQNHFHIQSISINKIQEHAKWLLPMFFLFYTFRIYILVMWTTSVLSILIALSILRNNNPSPPGHYFMIICIGYRSAIRDMNFEQFFNSWFSHLSFALLTSQWYLSYIYGKQYEIHEENAASNRQNSVIAHSMLVFTGVAGILYSDRPN